MSPDNSPLPDRSSTGSVEAAPATYGATGASLETFRRKYGPVEHTPLRKSHSVSVGPDNPFSPMRPLARTPAPLPPQKFDLWTAGGTDFPQSPNKLPRIRQDPPVKSMSLFTS